MQGDRPDDARAMLISYPRSYLNLSAVADLDPQPDGDLSIRPPSADDLTCGPSQLRELDSTPGHPGGLVCPSCNVTGGHRFGCVVGRRQAYVGAERDELTDELLRELLPMAEWSESERRLAFGDR